MPTSKGETTRIYEIINDFLTLEEAKAGNSYTENNYTVNIDNYYSDNGRTVQRDYLSRDTLEESR